MRAFAAGIADAILEALLDGTLSDELLERRWEGLAAGRRRGGEHRSAGAADRPEAAATGLHHAGAGSSSDQAERERGRGGTAMVARRASRSPTRASNSWVIAPCATCSARWQSTIGRHDTREMATGIEAAASEAVRVRARSIDAAGTILNAVKRLPAKAEDTNGGSGLPPQAEFGIESTTKT